MRPHDSSEIESVMALVVRRKAARIAKRFRFCRHDQEEFEQELTLQVLRRVGAFDPAVACLRVWIKPSSSGAATISSATG